MRTDYFTRPEFREFIGDTNEEKYRDAAIDLAQSEVIERLEQWAGSAWPNVDEDAETTDGVSKVLISGPEPTGAQPSVAP